MYKYFLYINCLYNEGHNNSDTRRILGEWLKINVGREGNARDYLCDSDWAWSLTTYMYDTNPAGIYFKHPEDMLRFKLTFGGDTGKNH